MTLGYWLAGEGCFNVRVGEIEESFTCMVSGGIMFF